MRVEPVPLEAGGEAAAWDPEIPGPFLALAGSQFLRIEGRVAVVRSRAGEEQPIYPGWFAVRIDGTADGEAEFDSPEKMDGGPRSRWRAA